MESSVPEIREMSLRRFDSELPLSCRRPLIDSINRFIMKIRNKKKKKKREKIKSSALIGGIENRIRRNRINENECVNC